MKKTDMDRRGFLFKGGLAAGGLFASSALPSPAGGDIASFERRGSSARLSLAYRHVHIGLEKQFSLLHISDTHLSDAYDDEGEETVTFARKRRIGFGGLQKQALAASLAWAKECADYVLHTGDLIDFQTRANHDLVKKLFGSGAPLFGAAGNHEFQREPYARGITNDAAYNALSRKALDASFGFDTLFSSTVVHGVNFICIDQSYGTVTAEQATRFEAETKKGLPIVLCQHVPFYTPELWIAHEKYWRRRGKKFRYVGVPPPASDYKRQEEDATTCDFIRYLKAQPLLKAILAGHVHVDAQDRFSPTAMEYLVAGNYLFHGAEILFS